MTMILIFSPKGGVGVTTVAAELALRLAAAGHDLVAVDLTEQPSLGYRVADQPRAFGEFANSADDRPPIRFRQVSRGAGRAHFALAQRQPGKTLVVDVAAGDTDTRDTLLPHADLALCILAADAGSLALLPQVAGFTDALPYYVLNLVDDRRAFTADAITAVRQVFGDKLLSIIRQDEAVNEALALFAPLATGSAAANDFATLATHVAALLDAAAGAPAIEDVA